MDAEDVAVNEGAEMLHREVGTEALPDPQVLQDVVEDVVSEPHSASVGKQAASSGKPVAPESRKIAATNAPDPYCFAGAVEGSATVEESAPVSIVELPTTSLQNPSPRKQRRPSKVATEVIPLAGLSHLSSRRGRAGLNVCMEPIGRERERNKLIILNVHKTLVD